MDPAKLETAAKAVLNKIKPMDGVHSHLWDDVRTLIDTANPATATESVAEKDMRIETHMIEIISNMLERDDDLRALDGKNENQILRIIENEIHAGQSKDASAVPINEWAITPSRQEAIAAAMDKLLTHSHTGYVQKLFTYIESIEPIVPGENTERKSRLRDVKIKQSLQRIYNKWHPTLADDSVGQLVTSVSADIAEHYSRQFGLMREVSDRLQQLEQLGWQNSWNDDEHTLGQSIERDYTLRVMYYIAAHEGIGALKDSDYQKTIRKIRETEKSLHDEETLIKQAKEICDKIFPLGEMFLLKQAIDRHDHIEERNETEEGKTARQKAEITDLLTRMLEADEGLAKRENLKIITALRGHARTIYNRGSQNTSPSNRKGLPFHSRVEPDETDKTGQAKDILKILEKDHSPVLDEILATVTRLPNLAPTFKGDDDTACLRQKLDVVRAAISRIIDSSGSVEALNMDNVRDAQTVIEKELHAMSNVYVRRITRGHTLSAASGNDFGKLH